MYYNQDTVLYVNGKFIKATDAHTDLYSQTLHYGYGVFEGIRAYQTVNGVKIFKAYEHFERLTTSCKQIGIPFDHDVEELTQISYQLLSKNNLTNAYIRPLVYCGPNMALTHPREVNLMICVWEWGKYLGDKLTRLCVSSYQRPNPNSLKIEGKVTGNYLNSILATQEAKDRGYDEALMLDMNGHVAQTSGANFFLEKDGVLYTAPQGHILLGVTRTVVMNICRELDIPVVEKAFKPKELEEADSAFVCGTAAEIAGVESIDAKPFRKEWKDSLGALVQEAYRCQVLDRSFSYVII
jgi:branched-chain amino acid aminotransferase